MALTEICYADLLPERQISGSFLLFASCTMKCAALKDLGHRDFYDHCIFSGIIDRSIFLAQERHGGWIGKDI